MVKIVTIVTIPRQMRKTRTEEYLNRKKYDSYHVVENGLCLKCAKKQKKPIYCVPTFVQNTIYRLFLSWWR